MILLDKFESFFPKPYWDKQDFDIEYQHGTEKIFGLEKNKQGLKVYIHQKILAISQKTMQGNDTKSYYNFAKYRELSKHFASRTARNIFIPAGRSFFSLLQKNIFRFLQTSNNIDPFLLEFGIFYENIKQTGRDIPPEARRLIASFLKGEYVPEENLLRLADGRKVPLELLSSGQQEALPLALVFAYIISLRPDSRSFSNIYVEEPEAHLFPDAQEQISRLISFLR
jgi:hypothetical protein